MEPTTYVISLDAIDLNLLYSTYKPRHNITPLWNVNRKDLCEFQIHIGKPPSEQQCIKSDILKPNYCMLNTQPLNNTYHFTVDKTQKHFIAKKYSIKSMSHDSTKLHEKMESIICHICNTHVPKQFLAKHNMSLKHKIYMEIAKTALKRIRKRINDENNNEEIQLNGPVYFCSHCVCVINIKKKKKHESSLNHKNSVFLDKQLSEFLNLYSNDIEMSDNDNDSEIVNIESNKIISSNKTTKPSKFEDVITRLDLLTYLNILRDKYKMTLNFKVINKGWLQIEIEGSKVAVAASHFYGLKENSSISSKIECVVCSEIVNYEKIATHIMAAKHMYRVSRPMKDIHCKREIYPLWHHCVLCNIMITNYKLHTISDAEHKKRLKEALKSDVANSVDNSTDPPKNVTLGPKTKSNKNDVTTQNLTNVTWTYKHLFKIEMGRLWCMVCEVAVNETDNIETHIKLGVHIEKYTLLLVKNKLQIQYNNDFFCGICKEVVVNNKELLHLNDICHKYKLQNSENDIYQTLTTSYYCYVCDVNVPNRVKNIQLHNRGKPHLKNINKKLTKKR